MAFVTKTKIALLALLVAFAGPASPYAGFSDVDERAFYADAVAWMVDQNITTGVSAGCFAPDDPISRADAMVFLWRHQGRPSASSPRI